MSEIFYRSDIAEKLLHLDGKPFSLDNYPFYRAIYDGLYQKTLLKTGRQVAKTFVLTESLAMASGEYKPALSIELGDQVLGLDTLTQTFTARPVTWISEVYQKPCLRITTRQGHVINVATTHPVRTWESWTEAGKLAVGDFVATVRQGGLFTETATPPIERIKLTAYLLGDGHLTNKSISFTTLADSKMDDFIAAVKALGGTVRIRPTSSRAMAVHVRTKGNPLLGWLRQDSLLETRSHNKFVPSWVFALSREDTALFLNRLFSTDGSIYPVRHGGGYAVEYATNSLRLAKDVQALLLKFGIPTSRKQYTPKVFRNRGQVKPHYKIRVETKQGVSRFIHDIGAITKTETVRLSTASENNNRDVLPYQVGDQINSVYSQLNPSKTRGSLHQLGIRKTPKYCPTRRKLRQYISALETLGATNDQLAELRKHATSDVFWDTIVSIEDLGIRDCMDLEVADTHNFILDGVVTHNSTTLANFMISESIGQPFFKNYFVAPSQEQTRRFSHTRIGKTLTYSADVRKAFLSDSIDNVFLRILKNGAEMAFTYACDDADRARGYSADRCNFDEVQDMLYDAVIPIVEECMANSRFAYSTYCGTPKTMENTIEFLWGLSSQTEWVIKCDACGKRTFIISPKVIGKNGPECLNCRAPLNPRNAHWVDMRKDAAIKGFHISQLILPENIPAAWTSASDIAAAQKRWQRILFKYETYGPSQFDNEVLGVSTALGSRLLSKEELEAMCQDYHMSRLSTAEIMRDITDVVAGVDWSGGAAEIKGTEGLVKSRTVLHIWGHTTDGRLKTLYYKIFPNGHATGWIDEIVEICNSYSVKFLIGDAGEGNMAMALLSDKLGAHRVQKVRYSGSSSKPIYWNPDNRSYIAARTTIMDSYALYLKQKRAIFPRIQEMQPAINDILNIYEEVTNSGNKVWRHAPTQPDDCFHAQLFGWLAWKLFRQDLTFQT